MGRKYQTLKILAILFSILGAIAFIVTIALLFYDGKIIWFTPLNLDEASKVGDFIGGFIGIFWSIAGILLLFITLRLQSDEFKETQKAIAKQQFETTFFNMMLVLGDIRSQIKYRSQEDVFESHEFIAFALNELKLNYDQKLRTSKNLAEEINSIEVKIDKLEEISKLEMRTLKDNINEVFLSFFEKYHVQLAHYFRYVYNLLKFTITNRKPENDEKVYLDLIQAQLSSNEMALIFYNSLSAKGVNRQKSPQFFNWIEEYSFLENIDFESLIRRAHHQLFPKTIFKFLNLDEIKKKASLKSN